MMSPEIMEPIKARRIEYVDVLRALALFFVILGHLISIEYGYFVFTSPIKLPLFFAITGFVFPYQRKDPLSFLKNTFWKLVVPWLLLTVPFALARAAFRGISALPQALWDILSGKTAWLCPAASLRKSSGFSSTGMGKRSCVFPLLPC